MYTTEIQSWRNGMLLELLLAIPINGTWQEAWARVEAKLEEAKRGSNWQGAQLTLDIGMRCMEFADLSWLVERLKSTYGLLTVAVVTTDNQTRDAAKHLGLATYLMLPGSSRANATNLSKNNALYLHQTLRSGQRIVHEGHIIINGDVNAGAEIIAEGDIIVMGTLRGLAHAGSQGDESATIYAGVMRPRQLRIAAVIARSPEDSGTGNTARKPEIARIENGQIQVDPA